MVQEVLGDLPQKTFTDNSTPIKSSPLEVPPTPTPAAKGEGGGDPAAMAALDRVLRLLQVGSKRFLTNKVCVYVYVYVRRYVHASCLAHKAGSQQGLLFLFVVLSHENLGVVCGDNFVLFCRGDRC